MREDFDVEDQEGTAQFAFSEKSIRMAFIRKVYGILMIQLAITVGFIALFIYQEDVKTFSYDHPELCWSAMAATLVFVIVLTCFKDIRRRSPINIILLLLFTICEGVVLGSVSALYDTADVMIAIGVCAAVCLALTLFALQTKWDFTLCGGIVYVSVIVLLMFGIVALCVQDKVVDIVYASLGALVFSIYLVIDTQLMLGGKHNYAISPEEYIFAALNLYLDIINIFLYILTIIGRSR